MGRGSVVLLGSRVYGRKKGGVDVAHERQTRRAQTRSRNVRWEKIRVRSSEGKRPEPKVVGGGDLDLDLDLRRKGVRRMVLKE